MNDGIATVQLKAWRSTSKDRPETVDRWKAVCRPIADKLGLGELRKKYGDRARFDAGLCESPDDHLAPTPSGEARDPIDRRKLIAVIEQLDLTPRQHELLMGVADGVPQSQIADEQERSHAAARQDLGSVRNRFRDRLMAAGLGALLAATIVFLVMRSMSGNDEANHQPTPAPKPTPSMLPTPPAPPPQVPVATQPVSDEDRQSAADLRDAARLAHDKKAWAACKTAFEVARKLDAAGETPAMHKQYSECETNYFMQLEAKPR